MYFKGLKFTLRNTKVLNCFVKHFKGLKKPQY